MDRGRWTMDHGRWSVDDGRLNGKFSRRPIYSTSSQSGNAILYPVGTLVIAQDLLNLQGVALPLQRKFPVPVCRRGGA